MTDYSALNNSTSIMITHGFNKQAVLWELKYIILPILVLIFVFFVWMIVHEIWIAKKAKLKQD